MNRVLCAALLTFAACGAFANGSDLLRDCAAAEDALDGHATDNVRSLGAGRCHGMIFGTLGAVEVYSDKIEPNWRPCPPQMNGDQAVRVLVKWLRSNPERLHLAETVVILLAFKDAYPCPAK